MPFNIDPDLPVPLGVQLRGVIEYGIVCGQLPAGLRLPPVRAMASQLNIAPMTVSQVYKELKDAGLLETKPGHGTFVSASVPDQVRPAILDLQLRIDQLLHDATAAGLSSAELATLINARINRRAVGEAGPAAGVRRPVRGSDQGLWRRHPGQAAGRRRDHHHHDERRHQQRPGAPAGAQCRPRPHPRQPQGRRRGDAAEAAHPRHQLHPVGAHAHPARPGRSAGAGVHRLDLSRNSCRS